MENSARVPAVEPDPAGAESDAEVVRRVREGERDAYRELVLRYQDSLYRYALRMVRAPDVAADLVQGALVKGYTHLDRCDPDRFGAWLFRILVNRCKDHLKNRRRMDIRLEDAGNPGHSADDPGRDLARSELRATLDGALAQLPDAQREAFLLKHVEGLSYEEIAERVGGSVPALKMRVHRARDALRSMLEEQP